MVCVVSRSDNELESFCTQRVVQDLQHIPMQLSCIRVCIAVPRERRVALSRPYIRPSDSADEKYLHPIGYSSGTVLKRSAGCTCTRTYVHACVCGDLYGLYEVLTVDVLISTVY